MNDYKTYFRSPDTELDYYLKSGQLGSAAILAYRMGRIELAGKVGSEVINELLRPEALSVKRVNEAVLLAAQIGWVDRAVSIYEDKEFFLDAAKLARRFGLEERALEFYRTAISRGMRLGDYKATYAVIKESGLMQDMAGKVKDIVAGLLLENTPKSKEDARAIAQEQGLEGFLEEIAKEKGIKAESLGSCGGQCPVLRDRADGKVQ